MQITEAVMALSILIRDIRKYGYYSLSSARAQLEAEVANSYLNWIWWVFEPFCMMVVYSFIFGTMFGMKTDGYAVFVFSGIMFFDFFSKGIRSSIKIVKRNKGIITKVYIPKFMLVASELFVGGFKMLMCLAAMIIMMLITGIPVTWRILAIIPIIADLYIFTFAVCTFMMHFGVFVEDLQNVMNIVLRFLFYFTGVFYSIRDKLPAGYSAVLLRCYPVAKLIDMARDACIYGKNINILYLIVLFLSSSVLALAGIYIVYRNENTYVKMI